MPVLVAVHLVAAALSVILGAAVLLLEKGTASHRMLGSTWVLTMFATALSSLGIQALNSGHFSWVHGLSLLTFVSLVRAIWAIRQGNVRGHRNAMRGSFVGLVAAGIAAVTTSHRLLNIIVTGWVA